MMAWLTSDSFRLLATMGSVAVGLITLLTSSIASARKARRLSEALSTGFKGISNDIAALSEYLARVAQDMDGLCDYMRSLDNRHAALFKEVMNKAEITEFKKVQI